MSMRKVLSRMETSMRKMLSRIVLLEFYQWDSFRSHAHLCQRGAISESGPNFAPVWTRQVRFPGPDSSKYAGELRVVRMMRDVD